MQWIDRLGSVWVEGQVAQLNVRPGSRTVFLTLRDPQVDMSLSATCTPELLAANPTVGEGSRIVVFGKLSFFPGRGTVSLRVSEIRAVGLGELLARIERLRKLLEAEGLFDPRLKRSIPFLPKTVGLITGRASAAEHDVVSVAQARWPAVRFAIRNVAVQGPTAVPQIVKALRDLDEDPAIDVIILARGGGSVEDLLPFSDETLCRTIVACTTPIVSAIGHEPDSPLSDYVADMRAATPTDAAKRVVPDAEAESAYVAELRQRSAVALRGWVRREAHLVASLRSRPVLANPYALIEQRALEVTRDLTAVRRELTRWVAHECVTLDHMRQRLTSLGPSATLERGYAIVQRVRGTERHVVRSTQDITEDETLRIRLADGVVGAVARIDQNGDTV